MTTTYLDLVAEKAAGRVTEEVRREISGLVSEGGVISEPGQLRTYECDGLTGFRVVPALVVLPASTEEVAAVVRVCAREKENERRMAVPAAGRLKRSSTTPTTSG